MFQKLRSLIRKDTAESSIMMMISQQVSLFVMAALGGAMVILITGGAKIQAENNAQMQLRIADTAFVNDVENAAAVYVTDDTQLTLSSTNWAKNTAGDPVCRVSIWYLDPASAETKEMLGDDTLLSLYNDITLYPTADCSSGSAPTSHQTKVAINAISEDSYFSFFNIAGRQLAYSNGLETGVADGSAAAQESDGKWDSWYTQEEWEREVPRIIQLNMTAVLPITANNDATIKATTNEAAMELAGNNDGIIDPGGEQTRWVPNPVTEVNMIRSDSVGATVGGKREGIQISWAPRPASECSPTQTLKYTWLLTNIRTNNQSSGETTGSNAHVKTGTGGAAEVWNGGDYRAQVASRCNEIDGQSKDTTALFTLPLPHVSGVAVTANGAQTTHNVTWNSVSTDPTTRYDVQYAAGSVATANSFTKQTRTLPNSDVTNPAGTFQEDVWAYVNKASMPWVDVSGTPTASTSISKSGNAVVAGHPDTYQVSARTADSPTMGWSQANYIYNAPKPDAPVIHVPANVWNDPAHSTISWDAATCTSGATAEYRAQQANSAADGTNNPLTATPQAATSLNYSEINQGSRLWVRVDVRCFTKFTHDPTNGQATTTLSPWSDSSVLSWDRPINMPAKPTGLAATNVSVGNGSSSTTSWSNPACAPGTNLNIYHQYTRVNDSYQSYWGAWLGASPNRVISLGQAPGSAYHWNVGARCESSATGALMVSPTNTAADSGYYSAVPAPTYIAITRSTASVPVGGGATVYAEVSGCAANTYAAWSSNPAGWKSYGSAGTRYWTGTAYCVGANGRTSGTVSDSTNINWYYPAPGAPSSVGFSGGSSYTSSSNGLGGWKINALSGYGSGGGGQVSGYTSQVNLNVVNQGWVGWSSSYGCYENVGNIQARSQSYGPGGTSGWVSSAVSSPTSLTRNALAC